MSEHDASAHHPQDPNDELWAIAGAELRRLAALWPKRAPLDNPPSPAKPTASQRRFDADFARLASPRLLVLVSGYAPLAQLEVYQFSAACGALWRAALARGANQLSEAAQDDLREWLARELLARLDDPLPERLITPERLAAITGEPR